MKRQGVVPAVDRAIRILELFRDEPGREWGVSEISRCLALNKSTTHDILTTLRRHRLLVQDPHTRRYRPDVGLAALAGAGPRARELTVLARPALEELLRHGQETVFLAVFDGEHITLVDKAESGREMSITSPLGRRLPHSAGALGKVFHAWLEPESLAALLGRRPLRAFTPRTLVEPHAYRRELEAVRSRGVAYDLEEYLPGVHALAVPVFDARDRPAAALCVVGPGVRLGRPRLASLGRLARRLAARVSAGLGGSPDGQDGRARAV